MDVILRILTAPEWSPYAVGVGIGVLSWLAFLLSDHPLGVSTAFTKTAGMIERGARGPQVEQRPYYRKHSLEIDWKWMLVAGLLLGASVAAWLGGTIRWEWVPAMWETRFGSGVDGRLAMALAGGVCVGFGARWGRGCTSGHGISGALQLVLGSLLAALCFSLGGIIVAFALYGSA